MLLEFAVAHIERFIIDEQAQNLAVGHVDHRLAVLRIAVSRFRIRQWPRLVERIEVGTGQPVGLALVEVAAQPDMAVGQREHRLRLRKQIEVERGLADAPRLDGEGLFGDHRFGNNSARSATTTVAPLRRKASAWPTRSTPTTQPKFPRLPASTPASASSKTAASAGFTPSNSPARRNESGAGLPSMCSSRIVTPSTRC